MNWNDYFEYDKATGTMLRRSVGIDYTRSQRVANIYNTRWSGRPAGCKRKDGYLTIHALGKHTLVHRIIWEMHHGSIVIGHEIDHIDGDKGNNKIENLRLCTRFENAMNRPKTRKNTSGYKGVSRNGKKWRAEIRVNGVKHSLGVYNTPEKAYEAYRFAALKLQGVFINKEVAVLP